MIPAVVLAYVSGLVASFSPCVVVLIPILLFRFSRKEEKQVIKVLIFLLGFLLTYILLALFIQQLIASSVQNGFKMGLGLICLTLGVLSIFERVDSLSFPLFKNTFLLGVSFSVVISSNPCVTPFFSIILSWGPLAVFAFGIGLVTPAILFAFIGNSLLTVAKQRGSAFLKVKKLMNFVLVIAGVYMFVTVKNLVFSDVILVATMLALSFVILMRAFFLLYNFSDVLKLRNLTLIVALLLIIVSVLIRCKHVTFQYGGGADGATCSIDFAGCPVCRKCVTVFSIAGIVGVVSIFINKHFAEKEMLKGY